MPDPKHLTDPSYGRPNEKQHAMLQEVTRAHVESFNYFYKDGIRNVVKHLLPTEFILNDDEDNPGPTIIFKITDAKLSFPKISQSNMLVGNKRMFPSECRERRTTYMGEISATIEYSVGGGPFYVIERNLGQCPIMVKSDACNLAKLKPAALISRGEEAEEMGGYFIINGNEKVVRLLILPRRNFPVCVCRSSWKSRGPEYTEYGITIRCVREDQIASNLILHYLQDGTVKLNFGLNKEMFFVPIVLALKALVDASDKVIYDSLIQGRENDSNYKSCIVFMLRQVMTEKLNSQVSVLQYLGSRFRIKLNLPKRYTDEEAGRHLVKQSICIHLEKDVDKFHLLVYMTQKLFAFVNGDCAPENPDNPMFQEVLIPGHLIQMVFKEQLEGWLQNTKYALAKVLKKKGSSPNITQSDINGCFKFIPNVTRAFEYLLATGNLISKSGLGLMQSQGLAIVADKLNFMRYISHFRAVHRGAFFTEMRTTTVRKLLPEAWGFLCPVHTPDGVPCGLLNHLSAQCRIVNSDSDVDKLTLLLMELGVVPVSSLNAYPQSECYTVMLDGRVLGCINAWSADNLVATLRTLKTKGKGEVPYSLEISLVKRTDIASQYPGLYLFSTVARMIRPVLNIKTAALEMIGTFEQVYLDISLSQDESYPGVTTHQEINEQNMLSVVANMTPFSDFNQSPRNMYQCQMGKQTMGFPLHSYTHRADNKLYKLETPQSPLVRPKTYETFNMDEYPLGTNTVVAVISYTGYDMEDAMILNKSSYERGFAHGCIIKSEVIDLDKDEHSKQHFFATSPTNPPENLDTDGLPPVGTLLTNGDPYYSYQNSSTGEFQVVKYKGLEDATVSQIKVLGDELGQTRLNRVCFVLRVARNPTIGDKFASRHGQKGICSMLWPATDMPFTESGMVPDIIFNPHGFPSRMTIGMMIESMAGKAGALHGMYLDATPFTFSEDQPAIDYFGQMLTAGGYNYYGTERLYSGITGQEMEADIYFGIVYYQRLRHMVSDKFQVRTTGPVDQVTQQPVKGRKRAGGVRFGEMERDALIAHGTSFLLQDRLFNCSDKSKTFICTECKSVLSPLLVQQMDTGTVSGNTEYRHQITCQHCKGRENIEQLSVPYVYRYLVTELGSIGIKVNMEVKPNK